MNFEKFFIKSNDNISVFYNDNSKYIKLRILKKDIILTNGYELYLNDLKSRSICRLHMNKKCNYQKRCTQIHISQDCIIELNNMINLHNVFNTCCKYHDDIYSKYNDEITMDIIIRETNTIVPKEYIAKTSFFENRNHNGIISLNNICRLHIQKKCFYYFDCRNIHICNSFFDNNIKNILDNSVYSQIFLNKIYDNNRDFTTRQNNDEILYEHDSSETNIKNNCNSETIISDVNHQWNNYSCDDLSCDKFISLYDMNIYKFEKYKKIFGIKYLYLCNLLNDNTNDNTNDNVNDIDEKMKNTNDNFFFRKFNI